MHTKLQSAGQMWRVRVLAGLVGSEPPAQSGWTENVQIHMAWGGAGGKMEGRCAGEAECPPNPRLAGTSEDH